MRSIRNRARVFAAVALAWQITAMAAVAIVVSWEHVTAVEHAGMENCPLHSKPTCPLHGDKHGTHDCDCPTIGCSQADTALSALFGAAGVLPTPVDVLVPLVAAEAVPAISESAHLFLPVPLSPPPRL
jgi:hypothetical protein